MDISLLKQQSQERQEAILRIKQGINIAKKNKRFDLVKALKRIALMDLGYRFK